CYLATYDEEDQQCQEHGNRSHDSTAQCFVDRTVDCSCQRRSGVEGSVFTNTVEDDHRIVHRETNYRQQGSNKVLVDLERERNYILQEREYYQHYSYVVQQGDDSAERVSPVAETNEDVKEDQDYRKDCR